MKVQLRKDSGQPPSTQPNTGPTLANTPKLCPKCVSTYHEGAVEEEGLRAAPLQQRCAAVLGGVAVELVADEPGGGCKCGGGEGGNLGLFWGALR